MPQYGNQWNRAFTNIGESIADIILQNKERERQRQQIDKLWDMSEGVRDELPWKNKKQLEAFSKLSPEYQELYKEALAAKEKQRQEKRENINQKTENIQQNRYLNIALGYEVPPKPFNYPSPEQIRKGSRVIGYKKDQPTLNFLPDTTKLGAFSRLNEKYRTLYQDIQDQTETRAKIEKSNGNIWKVKSKYNRITEEYYPYDYVRIQKAPTFTQENVEYVEGPNGESYIANVKRKFQNGQEISKTIDSRTPITEVEDKGGEEYKQYTKEYNNLIKNRKGSIEEWNAKLQAYKKDFPIFEGDKKLKDFDEILSSLPEVMTWKQLRETMANNGIDIKKRTAFNMEADEKIKKSAVKELIESSDKFKNAKSYLNDRLDQQRQEVFEIALKAAPQKIQQIFENNGWDSVYDMPPNKDSPEGIEKLRKLYNKWMTDGIEDRNDEQDMALQALRDLIYAKTLVEPEQIFGVPNAE